MFNPNTVLGFNSGVTNVLESSGSDATTDDFVTISFDVRSFKRINIMILNQGPNSITIKALTRNITNGTLSNTEIAAITLTSGSTLRFLNDKLVSTVELLIKSTSPGLSSRYFVEYIREVT